MLPALAVTIWDVKKVRKLVRRRRRVLRRRSVTVSLRWVMLG